MTFHDMLLDLAGPGLQTLPGPLPSNHVREEIPNGVRGTEITIDRMQDLVMLGKRDFDIRKLVGHLVAECPKKDYACYAEKLFNFCRDKIQYVYDPVGVEYLEHPKRILEAGCADCDSICILLACMFECAGFPAQFKTVAADPRRPSEFSHVYTRVKLPQQGWVPADATMPHEFGWEPQGYESRVWPASKDEPDDHDPSVMGMTSMFGLANFVDEGAAASTGSVDLYGPSQPTFAPASEIDFGNVSGMGLVVGGEEGYGAGYTSLASDQKSTIATLQDIYNGKTLADLKSLNASLIQSRNDLNAFASAVAKAPAASQPRMLDRLRMGREQWAKGNEGLIQAQYQYNFILDEAKRFGIDLGAQFVPSEQLRGLGVIPAIFLTAKGLALVAAVTFAAATLVAAIAAAAAGARGVASVLSEFKGVISAGGSAALSAAPIALIIGAAVLAFVFKDPLKELLSRRGAATV